MDAHLAHTLRFDLATAICTLQALPAPRTRFQRMLYSLLRTALDALDRESGYTLEHATRLATVALQAWRSAPGLSSLLPKAATG